MITDGKMKCDRCGEPTTDSITDALRVLDVTSDGMMVTMLFCRPKGCDKKVLAPSHLAARRADGHPDTISRTGMDTPSE